MAFRFTVHELHFLATAYTGPPIIVFHRLNGKCCLVDSRVIERGGGKNQKALRTPHLRLTRPERDIA